MLCAGIVVALFGAAVERTLLRRLYHAPELLQLLATFALVLIVRDFALWTWGAEDLLGPRAPGLGGAIDIAGRKFPEYDLFLIVLGPLMLEAARRHIPLIVETNEQFLNVVRYSSTITALIVALLILHAWLPAGRRGFLQILPGIVFTLAASLLSGNVFGQYLARFANNYVTMYAGLASVIIALVFLYFIAAIFVFGGELNAAIIKSRLPHGVSLQAAQSLAPADSQA